jgi:hypothetical protein
VHLKKIKTKTYICKDDIEIEVEISIDVKKAGTNGVVCSTKIALRLARKYKLNPLIRPPIF